MAQEIAGLVEVLKTGGPYAMTVFMALAYWTERKYTQELHAKVLELAMNQVSAMGALKSSVDGLEKTLGALASKL